MAFDIVLFAIIVAFLYLRLRGVLGQRTGFERPVISEKAMKELKDVIDAHTQPADRAFDSYSASVKEGLLAIRAASRQSFDDKTFLKGAELAFEAIVKAYSKENFIELQKLLGDDVYQAFAAAASARQARGENLDTTIMAIQSKEIVGARFIKPQAEITVKFVTEQINVTKDKEGMVVGGSDTQTEMVTDVWTFAREVTSKNPNWKLIKTALED